MKPDTIRIGNHKKSQVPYVHLQMDALKKMLHSDVRGFMGHMNVKVQNLA